MKHLEPCTKQNRPVLYSVDSDKRTILFFSPDCRTWNCEPCAQRRMRFWRLTIAEGVKQLSSGDAKQWQFVTLTSHAKIRGFEASRKLWPKVWKKLHWRFKRDAGKSVHYVMLPERHRDGTLHMHMITDAGLSLRWYKNNAAQCGGGHMAAVSPVTSPGIAAWYVTKYVTKTITDDAWPLNFNRVRTSRNWPKIDKQVEISVFDGKQWLVLKAGGRLLVRDLLENGYTGIDVRTGEIFGQAVEVIW
jgi:hypothetical protein